MKLEVKYLFRSSSLVANFYIYPLPESLEMRKISAHPIGIQKNPYTREDVFWIFRNFHRVMQVQSPTCTTARKFHQ